MKLQKISLGLAAFGFLASCAADGGAGVEGSPLWFMRTTPTEQAQYFQSICMTYGFSLNTPQMAQCIQTEATNARSNANRSLDSIANSNNTTSTNCTGYGNTMNCTSRTW
jgi:hypothetical protein